MSELKGEGMPRGCMLSWLEKIAEWERKMTVEAHVFLVCILWSKRLCYAFLKSDDNLFVKRRRRHFSPSILLDFFLHPAPVMSIIHHPYPMLISLSSLPEIKPSSSLNFSVRIFFFFFFLATPLLFLLALDSPTGSYLSMLSGRCARGRTKV